MASLVEVRQRVVGVRPELRDALLLSCALLAYGNATAVVPHGTREGFLLWTNLAVGVGLLVWAFGRARLTLAEAGLSPRAAPASAMFGVILAAIAALPPVLFIVLAPLFNGGAIEAEAITDRSGGGLTYFLLVRQPIGTALFEELTFRGVLYGAWRRAGDDRLALLASSAVFSAWHVVITSRTVVESGVVEGAPAVVAGVIVSLAGLLVGGLIFGYLRWHTRSIAAAAVGHWLIVAEMTLAVWLVG